MYGMQQGRSPRDDAYLAAIQEWSTPADVTSRLGFEPGSVSGVARKLSNLVRMGLAEWRAPDNYRATPGKEHTNE